MKERSFTGVGAASLVTVFAILCLSVFAALSLSGAKADQLLAQHAADTVTNYYVADTLAQRDYAGMTELLRKENISGLSGDAFYEKAGTVLEKAAGTLFAEEASYDAAAHSFRAVYGITEGTRLIVLYKLDEKAEDGLKIAEWRSEPEDIAIDESINVFDITTLLNTGN